MKYEEKGLRGIILIIMIVGASCVLVYALNKFGNTLGDLINDYYDYQEKADRMYEYNLADQQLWMLESQEEP